MGGRGKKTPTTPRRARRRHDVQGEARRPTSPHAHTPQAGVPFPLSFNASDIPAKLQADAALAKLLDAYEPGERDRCVSFEWLER